MDKVGHEYVDRETGIWAIDKRIQKRHRYDFALTGAIGMMFKHAKSIADVGCGDGKYCAVLKSFNGNKIIHGYEGTPDISSLGNYNDIMTVDLTKVRYVDIVYDLVLCLEVGEHIPKKHEQTFIDNLCRYGNKDLVLSWAVEGQGGTGHFNCQNNDYVISELEKRGLAFGEERTDILRGYAFLKWFKNTLMVFSWK